MIAFKVFSLLPYLYSKVATVSMNYKEVLPLTTSSIKKNKFKDF